MIHRIVIEYNSNKFNINFELFFGTHKKSVTAIVCYLYFKD